MKKIFIFILFIVCTTITMQAQPERGKFNPEEFRAQLEEFIIQKADFSNTEAQTFFPIFHKMKEEQRALQTEIFKLKKNRPEESNLSEKDYTNKIQRICELNIKMSQIQESYYKMYKVVPAQKVYKAMLAEDMFHRMMLRQMNQRRGNNHHKK